MRSSIRCFLFACLLFISSIPALALDLARVESRTDLAHEAFGVSGKGITIAVLDRGISWDHPDFINPDGTTRVHKILDQSGQNYCRPENPESVEYTQQQINDALENGTPLGSRDLVGHGDSTAGVAAGNGRSENDERYKGIAPEADLVIVKMTSEGAPASQSGPGEVPFNGCLDEAIEWAAQAMDELGQPGVLIINSGTQAGSLDGNGAVSLKLNEVFPPTEPGRIVVLSSGDEGSLPNHSKTVFSAETEAIIEFTRLGETFSLLTLWYSGAVPAQVTIEFDDGTTVGPLTAGGTETVDGVSMFHYSPGFEPYPWTSNSGDYQVAITMQGHATTGRVRIQALNAEDGEGTVDVYSDLAGPNLTTVTELTSHLTAGRLNDYATTRGVIIAGNYNLSTSWVDLDGIARSVDDEGAVNELWLKSSAGPTRDGRDYGVDVAASGQGLFAPVGAQSYWSSLRSVQPQGSNGLYVRFGGTSASAPIVVGAVALMLQVNPTLTTEQARVILRNTARSDGFTGELPNTDWGFGKLDVHAAVGRALRQAYSGPWFNLNQSGHGWFVEMLDAGGLELLNVYWYVYVNGGPAWLIATGELNGSSATLDAFITENGEFPPDFDGADVIPWGSLSFEFNEDGTGTASWQTEYEGFTSGTLPIFQLGRITGAPEGCRSGSYYNADQSGHGFVVEMIDAGGVTSALVAWYVYLNGEQVWLLGQAVVDGDEVSIPLQSFTGAQFPPDFQPGDVIAEDWGTLTLLFNEDGSVSARWETTREGYSSGALELVRLTGLGGQTCNQVNPLAQ